LKSQRFLISESPFSVSRKLVRKQRVSYNSPTRILAEVLVP
jgi:hypothetical protein